MATVLELRKNLSPLLSKETVYGLLFDVIRTYEAYLIDLNLLQLEKGEDIFGNVTGTYSRATELESLFGEGPRPIEPKREGEPYNYQWTGGLFDGMRMTISNKVATFSSTDSKAPMLKAKYGELFGLQDDHLLEAIQEKFYPDFMLLIRKQIQL